MEGFLHAVSSVTIILLLTATGYFCAARGWMGPQAKAFIGKFTLSVAIPCMSVYGLTNNLTRDLLVQSGSFLLVPLLGTVVITILSLLVGRLLKLPRKKLGVFMMMCSVSNAIFVGLAMCTELFGDTCTPYVMLYYLINTSFVQLLFLSLVRWSGESRGFDLRMLQKFLTTPAVIAVFVGLALVWFEVRLPSLVMSYCRYMNNLVTPLALLLTGYIIHDIGLKNVRLDRDLGIAMVFRFLLAPALSVALCRAFGVTGLAHDVLIVETAMPVVTQTVVAAAEYGADEEFAAQGAALSTIACFVVIPVLMLILSSKKWQSHFFEKVSLRSVPRLSAKSGQFDLTPLRHHDSRALAGAPIVPLPRNRLAVSAAGGTSPVSTSRKEFSARR